MENKKNNLFDSREVAIKADINNVLYLGADGVSVGVHNNYVSNALSNGEVHGNSTLLGSMIYNQEFPLIDKDGNYNEATNRITIGHKAQATSIDLWNYGGVATNQITIGHLASSSNRRSIAIGFDAQSCSQDSITIGSGSQSYSESAVSIGKGVHVGGNHGIGIGSDIYSSGDICIGHGNINYGGQNCIVIGSGITTIGQFNTLIGTGAIESGTLGIYDLGYRNSSNGHITILGAGTFSVEYGTVVGASAGIYPFDYATASSGEYADQLIANQRFEGGVALGNSASVYMNSIGIGAGIVTNRNGQIKLRAGIPDEEGTQEIELNRAILECDILVTANQSLSIAEAFKGFGLVDNHDFSCHTGFYRLSLRQNNTFTFKTTLKSINDVKYIDLRIGSLTNTSGVHINCYDMNGIGLYYAKGNFAHLKDLNLWSVQFVVNGIVRTETMVIS